VSMILTIRHLGGSLSGKSQRVALQEGKPVRLGRAPESEIKFSDTVDDSVSGLHAELSLQGGRLFVEDKRSSNGTLVNGAPCPPLQKVAVPDGARLRLGQQGPEMQVTVAPAAAGTVPAPVPKESVGRATLLREIDKARHDERNVVVGEIAKTRQRSGLWLGGGLVLVLLLAAGGIGGAAWWNHKKSERLAADLAVQRTTLDQEKNPWPAVEAAVSPAVVSIKCAYRLRRSIPVGEETAPALVVEDLRGGGGGSGVLIKPGLILTALHVVEPWKFVIPEWDDVVEKFAMRADYDVLEVQFPGQQPLKASVVAVSAEHDLAILQVQQTNAGPAPLGQTNDEVKVTEEIAILGYPGNLGQYQVQVENVAGAVVSLREITEVTPTFIQGTVAQPLTGDGEASHHLAFNAAIEPGNSGGPVVNRHGQVVGIVSFQFNRSGPPINILGEEVATQLPSQVGSRAVSPDDIQSFLRRHGFV
jgi:S1-C subfamily serine protease